MADTKLSALIELAATPAADDEVYIRDVSEAAADESKRITIANLMAASLSSKIVIVARAYNAATGDVAYTGAGFQPTMLIALAQSGSTSPQASWGVCDSSKGVGSIQATDHPTVSGGISMHYAAQLINCSTSTPNGQSAIVKSFDADGFTLTWTKIGDGSAVYAYVLCIR